MTKTKISKEEARQWRKWNRQYNRRMRHDTRLHRRFVKQQRRRRKKKKEKAWWEV